MPAQCASRLRAHAVAGQGRYASIHLHAREQAGQGALLASFLRAPCISTYIGYVCACRVGPGALPACMEIQGGVRSYIHTCCVRACRAGQGVLPACMEIQGGVRSYIHTCCVRACRAGQGVLPARIRDAPQRQAPVPGVAARHGCAQRERQSTGARRRLLMCMHVVICAWCVCRDACTHVPGRQDTALAS
eukprot:1161122-Pelagomonas_calceolata.AAC.9